jgi:hypothetical protein
MQSSEYGRARLSSAVWVAVTLVVCAVAWTGLALLFLYLFE